MLRRGVPRSINGETIRFPARWSRFYPSAYEPEKHAFLRTSCEPGTLAIDVGAHLGLFTVVMARAVGAEGRLLSFEPAPVTHAALVRVVSMNGLSDRVEIRPEAVSRTRGRAELSYLPDIPANSNSLVAFGNRAGRTVDVDTIDLDSFVQPRVTRVSCIKIDAEGAELDVLTGATSTLRAHLPALAIELHPNAISAAGQSIGDLWDLLDDLGYQVSVGHTRIERPAAHGWPDCVEIQAVRRR
jgi:FkbM family methyltransferase